MPDEDAERMSDGMARLGLRQLVHISDRLPGSSWKILTAIVVERVTRPCGSAQLVCRNAETSIMQVENGMRRMFGANGGASAWKSIPLFQVSVNTGRIYQSKKPIKTNQTSYLLLSSSFVSETSTNSISIVRDCQPGESESWYANAIKAGSYLQTPSSARSQPTCPCSRSGTSRRRSRDSQTAGTSSPSDPRRRRRP